jgi:hypothetical protein
MERERGGEEERDRERVREREGRRGRDRERRGREWILFEYHFVVFYVLYR